MSSKSFYLASRKNRWEKRLKVLFAILFPGVSHLLKQRVLIGSALCVLGIGALIDLVLCELWFSYSSNVSVLRSFDPLYSIMTPNISSAFPDLKSLAGETKEYHIQPWFWRLLIGHLTVYFGCAAISGWLQWKVDDKKDKHQIRESAGNVAEIN